MTTQDERIRIVVDLVGEKAWRELERDAKRFAETSKQVATQSKAVTRETQALTRSTGLLGNRIQNSAFQLGDFLVQVEAGTPPMRAFGQQSAQLLGAFGPMGAVLGVAAATVPILVTALMSGKDAAKEFADITDTLSGTIGRLTKELGASEGLAKELNNLAIAYNNATEAMRGQILLSLRADLLQARQEVSEMARSIGREINDGIQSGLDSAATNPVSASILNAFLPGGFDPAAFEANKELERAAELLGTTTQGASAFLGVLEQINSGSILPEDAPEQLDAVIVRYGLASEEIRKVREEIRKYQEAAAREESLTGFLAGGTGTRPVSSASGGSSGPTIEPGFAPGAANAGINMTDGLTDYQKHLQDLAAAQRKAWADLINSMEEVRPLGDQIFGSFERSFDAMVTGIAQGTQSIKDAFGNMARAMIADLVRLAAYRGILALLGGPSSSIGGAFARQTGQLQPVQGFARGGVVSTPTMFPMARGTGLMGEAGAEGIFPLTRSSNGDLAVKGSAPVVNVSVNTLPGTTATVSQNGNDISINMALAAVAADIARGGGPVSRALSGSFALQRAGV